MRIKKRDSLDVLIDEKSFSELPGTELELQAIINLFYARKKKAIGYFHDRAKEGIFKNSNTKNFNFIHIATHSLMYEDNPKISGLVFANPGRLRSYDEDGILYSGETYNLDLNAELIVLSSCESGIGKLVKGEGMIALNRGFFYSGARNIIISLWKVEDKTTSKLMIEFYRRILDDMTISTALQKAKILLIKNKFTAFPKYWSGFILIGR